MESIRNAFLRYGSWSTEPLMFLYMFSSFMKMPAFMALLFEKACYHNYNDIDFCKNISATKRDEFLQAEVSRLFMISSLTLLIPSIFTALFIGALSDISNIKYSMLIPFGGLLVSNVNYIIQSYFVTWHAYWLMPSDLIFGFCGGFSAVIGILFTYSTKISPQNRSVKIAVMEGAIGLGSAIGSMSSGPIRSYVGFVGVFGLIQLVILISFFYILLKIKNLEQPAVDPSESVVQAIRSRVREIGKMYSNPSRDPYAQFFLNLVLFTLFAEFVCFAGITDILVIYGRFGWTDKEYGNFKAISMGVPSLVVIIAYPILHKLYKISNGLLAIMGLSTKIIHVVMLAVVSTNILAMASLTFTIFTKFISTGLRAMASSYVQHEEQGKLFSLIALLQSFAFVIASPIFNGGYLATLRFYPGTMLLVIAVILAASLGLIIYIVRHPEEKRLKQEYNVLTNNNGGGNPE